jgi:succinate dehydrogenase / fumarate reductase cytochrome b subunit
LFLHLGVLGLLARGPGAYDQFLELTENPFIKLGEWLVVAAAILHGLNGIRIVLTSFGVGVTRQKQLFVALMAIAAVIILFFTVRMY